VLKEGVIIEEKLRQHNEDAFSVAEDFGSMITAKKSASRATVVGMIFGGGAGTKKIVSDIT
jgi:hypothetical protein